MNNKNFETYIDCGFSKIRAGAFNKSNSDEAFYIESNFFFDHSDIVAEIQKIITLLEKNTNEFIDDVNLMIDSPKMLSIGISVSKKFDGSKLRKEDVQFLIQQAKQQIVKNYKDQNIIHIIINNYRINDAEYTFLPNEINGNLLSLDILFICLPNEILNYFKNFFFKLNVSINQIACTSYVKSVNYKDKLSINEDVSFIDVGFNKTSITCYVKNKMVSLDVLPIGGNHITKDISKVLKVDIKQAESMKLNINKNSDFLNVNFSLDLLQKIAIARTEEILELCHNSIKLNLITSDKLKMVLMGEGSRILDNQNKEKISFSNDIDFLEETIEDICQSGFRLGMGLNKQEVVIMPKKQIKQGFFEKLFHFFT